MFEFNSKTAQEIIVAGRKAERGYVELVKHFGLTHESASADITEAARTVVVTAYPGTDPARLAGKNKNDDQRWCDARAVRAGLMRAIEKPDTEDDAPKPVILRATLSGEGGGTVTIPEDHPLYDAVVALITGTTE